MFLWLVFPIAIFWFLGCHQSCANDEPCGLCGLLSIKLGIAKPARTGH